MRGGWIHTGDVAKADADGFIYIVDRAKDMIISGGMNVYSVEVENVLMEHPDIREACVIGVPDDKWGEAVTAFVVPRLRGAAGEPGPHRVHRPEVRGVQPSQARGVRQRDPEDALRKDGQKGDPRAVLDQPGASSPLSEDSPRSTTLRQLRLHPFMTTG